jgi:hypothetical protein
MREGLWAIKAPLMRIGSISMRSNSAAKERTSSRSCALEIPMRGFLILFDFSMRR